MAKPNGTLPATRADFLSHRTNPEKTVFQVFDMFVVEHYEDPEFHKLINAIEHAEAVSGRTDIDDVLATLWLQAKAKTAGAVFADEPIVTLRNWLGRSLRLSKQSRKQRAARRAANV